MRVCLISANTEQINMPVLPMGLACVAAAVENAGHEVEVLNLMTREDIRPQLERALLGIRPDVIGISARNIDDQSMESPRFLLEAVKEVVDGCRALSPAPIVLGGAGYSIFPRSALEYLGADMGIRGEGETAFVRLLERLSKKADPAGIPGVLTRHGPNPAKPGRAVKLDSFPLPVPNLHLPLPRSREIGKLWLPFQTRRGCPMDCSYCSTATIEGRTLRKRSVDRVVDSMAAFAEAGFRHFFFVDNTFNFPSSYAMELCHRIAQRKLDVRWRCILYPWKVDEALVDRMARAGCVDVAFGFESGSRKILTAMNKRFDPEEVRRISRLLAGCGIGRMGFLMLGHPGETRDTVLESLSFADSLQLESVKVTVGIRIYPYTRLAAIASNEGVVAPGDSLLFPAFYLARELDGWLQETVSTWMRQRPHWHP